MSSSNNCISNIEETLKERKLKYTSVVNKNDYSILDLITSSSYCLIKYITANQVGNALLKRGAKSVERLNLLNEDIEEVEIEYVNTFASI